MLATNTNRPTDATLDVLSRPMSADEVDGIARSMTAGLGLDLDALLASTGLTEQDIALRLSMLAMSEAEKRIARQEQRIAQLESLSLTDELTGLTNRRGFRTSLAKAVAMAARGRERGLLVMIDLDGFKAVNDRLGHAAGDEMLVAVAAILREAVRGTDTVARLGGDEFAILMQGTSRDDAQGRLAAVENDLNSRVFQWRDTTLPIRASVGAVALDGSVPADDLLDHADTRMYEKKRRRRGDTERMETAPVNDAAD